MTQTPAPHLSTPAPMASAQRASAAALTHRGRTKLSARRVHAWFGTHEVLHGISLDIPAREITAVIGPSGCGKSTFLRCLNRMHELVPHARAQGAIFLDDQDVYDRAVDPVLLRRRVGMVFQKPNPFPTMSIRDNVLAGFTLSGEKPQDADASVERALRQCALWDEVKDKLKQPGTSLSGGQQQRLCIARTIAVEPDVMLMDEPCSALDPIATARIEELLLQLRELYTIVIVTHNMQQAQRCSNQTAFFLSGDLMEVAPTEQLFAQPQHAKTKEYITGKFG